MRAFSTAVCALVLFVACSQSVRVLPPSSVLADARSNVDGTEDGGAANDARATSHDSDASAHAQEASTIAEASTITPDATPDSGISGAQAWCAAQRAKMQRCDGEVQCGANFDAWCAKQAATNARAFEVADTACVNTTCRGADRSTCRYEAYARIGMSEAGAKLASAYCNTCTTVPACLKSTTTYDDAVAISDAFIAAWELSDDIADWIRAKCTGEALTIGPGGCVKSFGQCAADVYLAALPDCP